VSTFAPANRWGPHLRGVRDVEGVCDVEWARTQAVRVAVKECALDRGLVTVTGPVGVGKSFSVARAAEASEDIVDEIVWVELSSSVRGRALLASLYPQLAGGPAPKGDAESQLLAGLHLAVADRHRLLIVDEAQHITTQAMHALRGLNSHPDADCGLVLIGTDKLLDRLPPELRSRKTGEVRFERITDAEAPKVLAAYHPLFGDADPAVLSEANRRYAGGEFRWWAKLLVRLDRYLQGRPLTMAVIEENRAGL
jgi:type II secretory pathway predicted ATPase ExeA